MNDEPSHSFKLQGDKIASGHSRSYAAHLDTDGRQHRKPQSVAGSGNGSNSHGNSLRQPPAFQSRSGKQHR
jgi:hypothetical protein